MEVWEVASALGEATSDLEAWHGEYARLEREYEGESDLPAYQRQGVQYGTDLLAQRIAHAKGQGPAPEARVMSVIETSQLTRTLRGD